MNQKCPVPLWGYYLFDCQYGVILGVYASKKSESVITRDGLFMGCSKTKHTVFCGEFKCMINKNSTIVDIIICGNSYLITHCVDVYRNTRINWLLARVPLFSGFPSVCVSPLSAGSGRIWGSTFGWLWFLNHQTNFNEIWGLILHELIDYCRGESASSNSRCSDVA